MTSGYVLIVAIMLLGGVIATVGDRLGTKVGKARLSLFNLRPRQTAVLITILTGGIISASTLGILFAISDQLRTGVFELRNIQDNLAKTRTDLENAKDEKKRIENELATTKTENTRIQAENTRIEAENSVIKAENTRVRRENEQTRDENSRISDESGRTKAENTRIAAENTRVEAENTRIVEEKRRIADEKSRTQTQLKIVSEQERSLRSGIQQLQKLQTERSRAIAQRDQDIAVRDEVIAQSATRLKELETQRQDLEKAVQALDQAYKYYEDQVDAFTKGQVALFRGQVLSSGVVRIVTPVAARQAVDQLLREANKTAIQFTQPGTTSLEQQAIQITNTEVTRLIKQIEDGRDYVLRVLSAGNYVLGSKDVQVVASATPNQVVFRPGDLVASLSIDLSALSDAQVRDRVELLLAASEFRGRGAGVLSRGVQVGNDSSYVAIDRFIEQLRQYKQPVDIQALASEPIYTAGPLKIQLIAIQDGQVVFSAG